MDTLDAFEKELAREKAKREEEEIHRKEGRRSSHRHTSGHSHREKDDHSRRDRHRDRPKNVSDRHQDRDQGSPKVSDPDRDTRRYRDRHRRRAPSEEGPHDNDGGSHRHKRLHVSTNGEGLKDRDRVYDNDGGDQAVPDGEKPLGKPDLERDSWMRAPSGTGIDYVHRNTRTKTPPPSKDTTRYDISGRELNHDALRNLNHGKTLDDLDLPEQSTPDYTFGDEGSQWRMTKLNGVYTVAQQTNRTVDEVAVERFGSLRDFDEAREEKEEMERRRLYGKGYVVQEHPTGNLFKGRSEQSSKEEPTKPERTHDSSDNAGTAFTPVDQTTLNRLRAQLMKAKLRKLPDTERLEEEYNAAMRAYSMDVARNETAEHAVVLDAVHSRMLAGERGEAKEVETKRGRGRGLVEANEDMSIADMVREERRTRGVAGGESLRLAERIAKDTKFDDDLEYLDENAESLAKRLHKSKATLKTVAVHEYTKMNKILESCPLCHHEDRKPPQDLPLAPIVSLATRVFLTLATEPELPGAEGGAVIVPIDHHTNLLECNDDEWEEIRNFMKSLTRLYHDQGRDVLFYENAATPHRRMHAALVAVPIPYELGNMAPAFFREAMLSADEEWSQHKKIINTAKRARDGMGKAAFRKSIAKEMPYFHAWFTLDGGLGHIVEDAERWPRGDLFAREIVGGMLDVDASIIKRQGRWLRTDQRVDDFQRRWRRFDWTRVLTSE